MISNTLFGFWIFLTLLNVTLISVSESLRIQGDLQRSFAVLRAAFFLLSFNALLLTVFYSVFGFTLISILNQALRSAKLLSNDKTLLTLTVTKVLSIPFLYFENITTTNGFFFFFFFPTDQAKCKGKYGELRSLLSLFSNHGVLSSFFLSSPSIYGFWRPGLGTLTLCYLSSVFCLPRHVPFLSVPLETPKECEQK